MIHRGRICKAQSQAQYYTNSNVVENYVLYTTDTDYKFEMKTIKCTNRYISDEESQKGD